MNTLRRSLAILIIGGAAAAGTPARAIELPAATPPAAEKAPPPTTRGVEPHDRATIQQVHDFSQLELQMGRLAQTRGASKAVKDLGRRLVADHTAAEQKLDGFLRKRGTSLTELATTSTVDADHEMLATKTGSEFDLAFALQTVADDTKAIEVLQSARIATGDEELLARYEDVMKTLQAHRRAAQDIVAASSPHVTSRG